MAETSQQDLFNFPDIELYENDKPIKVLNDQTFLTEVTDKAIDFIKRNKEILFLYLPHLQPHVPLFASDKFVYHRKETYGDVINEIDYSAGRILMTQKMEKLEENKLQFLLQTMGHGSLMVAIQDLLVFLGR